MSPVVEALLTADADMIESAAARTTPVEVAAALGATFSIVAAHVAPRIPAQERRAFYRRVAARTAGEAPLWMAEAAFRSAEENDPDALTGADEDSMTSAMIGALNLLANEYLTDADRDSLYPSAVAQAVQNLPLIEELAASRSGYLDRQSSNDNTR